MVWESYRVGYVNRINTPANATVYCSLLPSDSNYGMIMPTHLAVQNGRGAERVEVIIDGIKYECGQYSNVAFPIFDGYEAVIKNGNNPDVEIFLLDEKHAAAYLARYTSFPAPIDPTPPPPPPLDEAPLWVYDCLGPLNTIRVRPDLPFSPVVEQNGYGAIVSAGGGNSSYLVDVLEFAGSGSADGGEIAIQCGNSPDWSLQFWYRCGYVTQTGTNGVQYTNFVSRKNIGSAWPTGVRSATTSLATARASYSYLLLQHAKLSPVNSLEKLVYDTFAQYSDALTGLVGSNTWMHIGMYSQGNGYNLYINGVGVGYCEGNASGDMIVLCGYNGGGTNRYTSRVRVGDIRYYNRVLGGDERGVPINYYVY